ncbi:erythromycin esterase family protein [Undibacterium sp. RTI2.1]|uniref:erythromycin esterase family protein n=1 Tax=unclassified Undibacterium TaxID=2630295 RepID=UPI002B222049|nr:MULTISPECIES: erythromycin esterase family protein [unclassified Undibacterium]MEB0032879.1 erythromycin esterase family protein [Undibacterium sp. RTI2.1]MEB0118689.1 erythromycin esterase family protein [Undibacterium sp. RTI2.2]
MSSMLRGFFRHLFACFHKPILYVSITIALCSPSIASAGALNAANLGFEEWQAGQNLPTSWNLMVQTHTVSADCQIAKEGKCSLKLESNPQTQTAIMTVVAQTLDASRADGHPLYLSGWIKTKDLRNGRAVLIFQVNGQAQKVFANAILGEQGPTGTNDWQRFEIQVPVPGNAAVIYVGIGLSGTGTAWFDDLKLEIDESIKIADVADVRRPAPPQKSMQLVDEQSMVLPESLMLEISSQIRSQRRSQTTPEWQMGIRQSSHGLRSLFSDDFSDLQFLKPLLKDKRIVQLGESAHGVAEFNWMKIRLIKFLHQEMGFDVIAMEASMTTSHAINANIASMSAVDAMTTSQFGTIGTKETLGLFEYLKQSRTENHPLQLAGFDIQNSGWKSSAIISARFKTMLNLLEDHSELTTETKFARQIDHLEQELNLLYNTQQATMSASQLAMHYSAIADELNRGRTKLLANDANTLAEVDMTIQEARSRVALCNQLAYVTSNKKNMEIRDQAMADNLNFLLDKVYPQKKFIVWAHNTHVVNNWVSKESPKTMGVWMAEKRRKEMYTIGLYMGRGVLGSYAQETYSEIPSPPVDSLESILANGALKMNFVDFSQAKADTAHSWMSTPVNARFWGGNPEKIIPNKAYDAVIYIDSVTPSFYMK